MNYIFFADGFETIEGLCVVDMLRRAGLPITTVSMNESTKVTTAHKVMIECDTTFGENKGAEGFTDADFLIIPGGMPGTVNLENNAELCKLLTDHAEAGKNVAAICAAPRVLGMLGILDGRTACCYPGFEDRLKGAKVSFNEVETDGNVITGRGMGTAIAFGAAIIAKIAGDAAAQKVKESIVYRQ